MLEDPSPRPYSLYMELGDRIKQGLNSGREVSPVVRVDMTFDKVQFDGVVSWFAHSVEHRYRINHYQDLNSLVRGDGTPSDFGKNKEIFYE